MNLQERIAQAINPESWTLRDDPKYAHLKDTAGIAIVRQSLEQAQAVIDELGLEEERDFTMHADVRRYVTEWETI